MVPIELVPLDSERVFRFEVDPDASIGQVLLKFKKTAFEQFGSHHIFESYRNGKIVFINEGCSSKQFDFSDAGAYTRFLKTREIREYRRQHGNVPLIFQLIRCPL